MQRESDAGTSLCIAISHLIRHKQSMNPSKQARKMRAYGEVITGGGHSSVAECGSLRQGPWGRLTEVALFCFTVSSTDTGGLDWV